MSLLSGPNPLPEELRLMIIDHLVIYAEQTSVLEPLRALAQTCRHFHTICNAALYDVQSLQDYWDTARGVYSTRAMCWAIGNQRDDTVRRIIQFTPKSCKIRDLSALMMKGQYSIVHKLLDVDEVRYELTSPNRICLEDSPTYQAIKLHRPDVLDHVYSIQGGPKHEMVFGIEKFTKLDLACKFAQTSLVDRFIAEGAGPPQLRCVFPAVDLADRSTRLSWASRPEIVSAIFNRFPDIRVYKEYFFRAIQAGSVIIVDELIERGLLGELRDRSDLQRLFRSVLDSRNRHLVERYPSMVARAWLQSGHSSY